MKAILSLVVLAQIALLVSGHGWLNSPEPRGYVGNTEGSASTTGPCGQAGVFNVTANVDNYGILSVFWTIGGGHTGTAGPNTCRFAVSNTTTAAGFDANVVAAGFNCNAGQYRKNITVYSESAGTNYLQFMWAAGDGGHWYSCSQLEITQGNISINNVVSGAAISQPIVSGNIDFFKIPVLANHNLYIVASGPTGVQLVVNSGSMASITDYDKMINLIDGQTQSVSVCGVTSASTTYIAVYNNEATTGSYTFTATDYAAQVDYVAAAPQVVDSLASAGSKFYYTGAYTTGEVPKRIVFAGPSGMSLSQSTQCVSKATPDKTIAEGSSDACLDLATTPARKYLEVSHSASASFTISLEKGTCASRVSASVQVQVSSVLLVTLALFLMMF